jgi:hypothetical protein
MSEDEEEIEQKESWKANQQRLKEMERDDNEADFEIENISRNDSIAINLINEEQSKRDREKAHLEKKQMQLEKLKKKEEEEKDFIETVENIIAHLKFEQPFEFSYKLSTRKRELVHQLATKHNIFHESSGEGKLRKITIKKLIVPETVDGDNAATPTLLIENNSVDELTSVFKKRCGLRTPSKRKTTKKFI